MNYLTSVENFRGTIREFRTRRRFVFLSESHISIERLVTATCGFETTRNIELSGFGHRRIGATINCMGKAVITFIVMVHHHMNESDGVFNVTRERLFRTVCVFFKFVGKDVVVRVLTDADHHQHEN